MGAQMRKVSNEERRARLGVRHRLAASAKDELEATKSLVAFHSSDPATVFLSAWARVQGLVVADLESSLYEDRSLLRIYGMRRTLWVVDRTTVPLVHNSSTIPIAKRERRRTAGLLERAGVTDDGAAWLAEFMPRVQRLIREEGEILTRDLTPRIDGLGERVDIYSENGKLQGTVGLGSRAILQLSFEGRVIRARPAGSWISGQYRWADMSHWLGSSIEELPMDVSSARLVERWLRAFGPATEIDLSWWTGWSVTQVREALADVGAVEVEVEPGVGYVLEDDLEPVPSPQPWVALLPSLDPTPMGWKERDWYLGGHGPLLFDRNGNAGPTVWVDGRVVGGWAQRKDGAVVYEILEDIGAEAGKAIAIRAAELESWLDGTVVTPRFRSPHDRKLTG